MSRLVKTPKVHVGDTGLAATLMGVDAAALAADRPLYGQLLETFVCFRRFAGGAVLYDGETTATFGDRLFAVPIRRLWEG